MLPDNLWFVLETSRTRRRKKALTVDNSDVGWFSTPPSGDGYLAAEEGTFGTQAAAAGNSSLTKLAEPSPHGLSSPSLDTPPISTSHPDVAHGSKPSASVTTSAASSSSTKLPLTTATGRSHGTATYAYKTVSYEQSSPIRLPSVVGSFSATMSAIPPIPVPSTSREKSDRNSVRASPEPTNGGASSEGLPSGKQRSGRKKRRKLAAAAAAVAAAAVRELAVKEASPVPIESVTAVPAVQNRDAYDLPRRDDDQTKLEVDDLSTLADMLPEQDTVAQRGGEKARSREGVDDVSGVGEAEEHLDDPELNMRAGLIVNGVSLYHETLSLLDDPPFRSGRTPRSLKSDTRL